MLSTQEIIQLDNFLTMQRSHIQTLEYLHHQMIDSETKQCFLDLIKKNQNQFSSISKHINSGQPMYP